MSAPIYAQNSSGGTIPAFGLVKVTGASEFADGQPYLIVDQPDGDGSAYEYYVNTHFQASSNYAAVHVPTDPTWILYDTNDGTPAAGEEWGPKNNSYKLAKDSSGFIILGHATGGRVLATRKAGQGGTEIVRFSIDSADCANSEADVSILARPCDMSTVSDEASATLTVHDPAGCYLNEPDEDLAAREGWAAYMKPVSGGSECRWEIFALCGSDDCE